METNKQIAELNNKILVENAKVNVLSLGNEYISILKKLLKI